MPGRNALTGCDDMIGFRVCDKGEAEYEGSRFFGEPLVPEKWAMKEPWSEDCFFMCQINIDDIKGRDRDGLLPKKGMLYFFVNTDSDEPDIKVFYTAKEPDTIYEECNMGFGDDVPYDLFTDYVMKFTDDASENFILGAEGDDVVLFQYDPSESEADVFSDVGKVRVTISREALAAKDFASAVTSML